MFLAIDLSERACVKLCLFDNEKEIDFEVEGENRELLESIDSFFIKEKFDKEKLLGIAVVVGSGAFTSTRIATTTANAFAFALGVPVLAITIEDLKDKKKIVKKFDTDIKGKYISATYSAEPNIGKKK